MNNNKNIDFDAIVVGSGFAGLALIHYLRDAGLSVKVFDKAADIGGTWTWNRYPGAMTDSEGYYYCLTFSKELLQKWTWSKRYPAWDETHRYMHFVADECDMWPHIQLNTEVTSAEYQKDSGTWLVTTADGKQATCKYFISAMGMISDPVIPKYKGLDSFKGPLFHSARWPEGLEYEGKRIGIIGSGATTVQMLPVIAQKAASVTVFQRTPNFILPAMQKEMTPEWEKDIKDNYDEIIAKCRNHVFGMAFESSVGRNAVDTPAAERQKIFEDNWNGSFRWVFETFDDLLGNADSNRMASEFIINKMKERIDDPEIAKILCPELGEYPLFAKRPPLDHGYLEAYSRDNVNLVDIRNHEPIVEITETGIRTTENEFEFDIIILATGFRAYTGSLEALTIRGESGQTLAEKWDKTSKSIMGVCVADFPNMFTITGPQAPFANLPTSIEQNAMWITDCIKKMKSEGHAICTPKQEAEDEWSAHVADVHSQTLMNEGDQVNSWMMGANIENHEPRVLIYFGGAGVYYDKLRESVDTGFPELTFDSQPQ
jgi:cyclohexanone monooxygenase|tara:strand:+ start:8907 stop:10535 length:1629 start_codon:yes stop_codon:yes gene_type:complete